MAFRGLKGIPRWHIGSDAASASRSRIELAAALQWLKEQEEAVTEIGYPRAASLRERGYRHCSYGIGAKGYCPALLAFSTGTGTETHMYRLRAVARMHDSSVIPTLRWWKEQLKDSPGLQSAIDSTIADIEH